MKLVIIMSFLIAFIFFNYLVQSVSSEPFLYDKDLKIEKVYSGLKFPVSMSFLGENDILVLEKNDGTVNRIINGQMQDEPLLHVDVDGTQERGLLGSAVSTDSLGNKNVYLYFTELENGEGTNQTDSEKKVLGNRIYKYDFEDGKLDNPELLFEIPDNDNPPVHVGGKMIIGPDDNLYVAIGDLLASNSITQNFDNGTDADGSGGIIRMNLDGGSVEEVFEEDMLDKYFGYGIRNSFGLDFDPLTGNLWDTENGPGYGDEINLVSPGFNSGWKKVQGLWKPLGEGAGNLVTNFTDLFTFGQEGKYAFPKMTWFDTIGITAIKFMNSNNLGESYYGDMFVGDFNTGDIYRFKLNENRSNILSDSNMISEVEVNGENHSVIYHDPFSSCYNYFRCNIDEFPSLTNNDLQNKSIIASTPLNNENIWSWIYGLEYGVNPGNTYSIVTSLSQNEYAVNSHIAIKGFNETSHLWDELIKCPPGKTGFINLSTSTCNITIPNNVSKIQPLLNAGWSSMENKEATTNFSGIKVSPDDTNEFTDLMPNLDPTSFPVIGRDFGYITDIQVGPDGNLYILSINPEQIVDLDPERSYQGRDGVIYKISKK